MVEIKDLTVVGRCSNPISPSEIKKYINTLIAFREGKLSNEYQTVETYRIDEESEQKLGSLRTGIGLTVTVFIIVIIACIYKIRQYSKSIIETKDDISKERAQLIAYQDEVISLRQMKLLRFEEMEQNFDKQN